MELLSGSGAETGLDRVRPDTMGALFDAGSRILDSSSRSAAILLLSQRHPSLTDERDSAAALHLVRRWRQAGLRCWDPVEFPEGADLNLRILDWLNRERPEVVILPNEDVGQAGQRGRGGASKGLRVIVHRLTGPSQFSGYRFDAARLAVPAIHHVDRLIRSNQLGLPKLRETIVVEAAWWQGISFP